MDNERSFDEILDDMEKSLERMDRAMDGFNDYGAAWLVTWLGCCGCLLVFFLR